MNNHRGYKLWLVSAIAMVALSNCSHTPADTHSAASPAGTDMRAHMAHAHENAAACLRSERPMAECRQEMMRAVGDEMGGKKGIQKGGNMHEKMQCKMMDAKKADDKPSTDAHEH
jgi:hypothetical protein